jgi:hypothetical protein
MMKKPKSKPKSWADKLKQKRAPKIVRLETDFAGIKAGSMLFVGTPMIIEDYIRKIPLADFRTIHRMRNELARKNQCDATCPVSTAIFLRMISEAAIEQLAEGKSPAEVLPFWRIIEPDSTIAKKLSIDSAWIAHQRELELHAEI